MSNVISFPPLRAIQRELKQQAARHRTFMDATGLRRSRGWSRTGASPLPHSFDHTCLWLDRAGKYIVTTEPYSHKTVADFAHLTEQGWTLADSPWPGMWNPPDTRLILASPPRNGGDLAPVIEAVASLCARQRQLA